MTITGVAPLSQRAVKDNSDHCSRAVLARKGLWLVDARRQSMVDFTKMFALLTFDLTNYVKKKGETYFDAAN